MGGLSTEPFHGRDLFQKFLDKNGWLFSTRWRRPRANSSRGRRTWRTTPSPAAARWRPPPATETRPALVAMISPTRQSARSGRRPASCKMPASRQTMLLCFYLGPTYELAILGEPGNDAKSGKLLAAIRHHDLRRTFLASRARQPADRSAAIDPLFEGRRLAANHRCCISASTTPAASRQGLDARAS